MQEAQENPALVGVRTISRADLERIKKGKSWLICPVCREKKRHRGWVICDQCLKSEIKAHNSCQICRVRPVAKHSKIRGCTECSIIYRRKSNRESKRRYDERIKKKKEAIKNQSEGRERSQLEQWKSEQSKIATS